MNEDRTIKDIEQDYTYSDDIMNEDDERVRRIKEIINTRLTLPDKILILLYAEVQSYRKLGKRLGFSHTTVRKEVVRVRKQIQEELKKLPTCPGVYMHKDSLGEIIYVGKAVNLRNRVRSYFRETAKADPKVRAMVSNIAEFEYITCATEMEALILECNLIVNSKIFIIYL